MTPDLLDNRIGRGFTGLSQKGEEIGRAPTMLLGIQILQCDLPSSTAVRSL